MAIVLASTQVILRIVIHHSLKITMRWLILIAFILIIASIGQAGLLVYAVDAFQITKFMENLSHSKVNLQKGPLDVLAES